jgi:hypothetical protein
LSNAEIAPVFRLDPTSIRYATQRHNHLLQADPAYSQAWTRLQSDLSSSTSH